MMILERIWRFFTRLLERHVPLEERCCRVFPENDRNSAIRFYTSWAGDEYLPVQLGGGIPQRLQAPVVETAGQYFLAADFAFFAEPIDAGDHWILASDSEDDMEYIALDKATGKVVLAEGDLADAIPLANGFREFLLRLREKGWQGPAAWDWGEVQS